MAIAFVQQAFSAGGGPNSVTLPGATTPGNFLVAVITERAVTPQAGPTSTHGTWLLATTVTHPGDNLITAIWYVPNIVGTSTTINFGGGHGDDVQYVLEYSGIAKNPLDQVDTNTGTSTSASAGPTPTTTKANELWIAGLATSDGGTTIGTPTGGFAFRNQQASGGGSGEVSSAVLDQIAAVTGTPTAGATLSASDTWVGAIATFRGVDQEAIDASIPAVSNLTASMLSLDFMTASIASVGAMTGNLQRFRRLPVTIPAVSTLDATLKRTRNVSVIVNTFSDMVGTADVVSSELVINTLSATEVEARGGEELILFGVFPVGQVVEVWVGPLGTVEDPQAYSGVPGQGNIYRPRRPDQLRIFLPRLPPGVHRIHAESAGDSFTLVNAITVRPKQFRSNVYGLRKVLPPKWKIGPRRVEDEA